MYGVQRGTPYGYSIWDLRSMAKESGSCPAPTALTASAVTETGASLNWSPIVGIAGYLVQYKAVTAANWQQAATTTNSLQLNNLACNTPYLFHVQTVVRSALPVLIQPMARSPRWSAMLVRSFAHAGAHRTSVTGIVGSACFNSTTAHLRDNRFRR